MDSDCPRWPLGSGWGPQMLFVLLQCLSLQNPPDTTIFPPTVHVDVDRESGTIRVGYYSIAEECKALGAKRAEADFATGNIAFEVFGLRLSSEQVHPELGIYVRYRGCVITNHADVECDAYNSRIAALMAERGLPEKLRTLGERFRITQGFDPQTSALKFVPVPKSVNPEIRRVSVGRFEAAVETIPVPDPRGENVDGQASPAAFHEMMEFSVFEGGQKVGEITLLPDASIDVAYWPQAECIVVRSNGRSCKYYFYDAVNHQVMWRYPEIRQLLKKMLDEEEAWRKKQSRVD